MLIAGDIFLINILNFGLNKDDIMEFSVIIPVYNARKVIKRCVTSIVKQTYKNYELIMVDDGSTDNWIDEIESIIKDINCIIIKQENKGVSCARNKGLDAASGEYVLFLDSDDELTETAIEKFYTAVVANNYPDILFSGFFKIYPNKVTSFKLKRNTKVLRYDNLHREFVPFIPRLAGTVWAKCYKREALKNHRFNIELQLCEDAEFNYRLFNSCKKYVYVNTNSYRYYYTLSSTIRKYNSAYINMYIKAISKIRDGILNDDIKKYIDEFSATVLNVICFNVIFARENKLPNMKKIDMMKNICEDSIFKTVLAELDMGLLPFKHKLTIYIMKNKVYFLLPVINLVNNIINRIRY